MRKKDWLTVYQLSISREAFRGLRRRHCNQSLTLFVLSESLKQEEWVCQQGQEKQYCRLGKSWTSFQPRDTRLRIFMYHGGVRRHWGGSADVAYKNIKWPCIASTPLFINIILAIIAGDMDGNTSGPQKRCRRQSPVPDTICLFSISAYLLSAYCCILRQSVLRITLRHSQLTQCPPEGIDEVVK